MLPQIPGNLVEDRNLIRGLQRHIHRLIESDSSPRKFPGAQPISFEGKHLQDLLKENYYVSEKADGVRCLLFTHINEDGVRDMFLIDRKNEFRYLNLGLIGKRGEYHKDTLLDAELVFETLNGREELFLLLFDALVIDGLNLTEKPYNKRLGPLRQDVCIPYVQRCQKDKHFAKRYPFLIRQKRIELAYNLPRVFNQMESYHHKTDGVIFTSERAPYTFGTCDKILKWKPAEENTVDFRVAVHGNKFHIEIWVDDVEYKDLGEITIDDNLRDEWLLNSPQGRIIECRYDPTWPGNWKFSRYREDKDTANHITVFNRIMVSIKDNVKKEELVNLAPEIEKSWKIRNAEQ